MLLISSLSPIYPPFILLLCLHPQTALCFLFLIYSPTASLLPKSFCHDLWKSDFKFNKSFYILKFFIKSCLHFLCLNFTFSPCNSKMVPLLLINLKTFNKFYIILYSTLFSSISLITISNKHESVNQMDTIFKGITDSSLEGTNTVATQP